MQARIKKEGHIPTVACSSRVISQYLSSNSLVMVNTEDSCFLFPSHISVARCYYLPKYLLEGCCYFSQL